MSKSAATVTIDWGGGTQSNGVVVSPTRRFSQQTTQCGSTALADRLPGAVQGQPQEDRQRLRECSFAAEDTCGLGRRELDVQVCFVPLARWVLAQSPGTRLALDATTLADKHVIVTVGVLDKGCAVPIAWKVLPAGKKPPWKGK